MSSPTVLTCPNDGCEKIFNHRMEKKRHLDSGKCKGKPSKNNDGVMQNITNLDSGYFSCDICKIEIKYYSNISRHKMLCKGQKQKKTFPCLTCGMTFNFKSKSEKHLETHKEALVCDKCDRFFRRIDFFQKHVLKCNSSYCNND